jgi:hypothetical protein
VKLTDPEHPLAKLITKHLLRRPDWIRDWFLKNRWIEQGPTERSWRFAPSTPVIAEPPIEVMIVASNDKVLLKNRVKTLLRISLKTLEDPASVLGAIVRNQAAIDRLAALCDDVTMRTRDEIATIEGVGKVSMGALDANLRRRKLSYRDGEPPKPSK